MKVLFLCPFVPWPLETGGKIRTYHLLREASRNADVHLRGYREEEAEKFEALMENRIVRKYFRASEIHR